MSAAESCRSGFRLEQRACSSLLEWSLHALPGTAPLLELFKTVASSILLMSATLDMLRPGAGLQCMVLALLTLERET